MGCSTNMSKKHINMTKKRIVAIVLAVYFYLLGASYFGLHRAQDDWQIAYLRWDQATLISGEIGDIKALKASLKEAGPGLRHRDIPVRRIRTVC